MSFHELLKSIRKDKHISLKRLCAGLCSAATLSRMERGELETTKMMRDRLLGRAGISLDGFEEYLFWEEYVIWKRRQEALDVYADGGIDEIKAALQNYREVICENQSIALQLAVVLEAYILKLEKKSRSQINLRYKKAMLLTLPTDDISKLTENAMSVQEISIVLDYIDTLNSGKKRKETVALLLKMLQYIEDAGFEDVLLVKVYSKALYLYLKHRTTERITKKEKEELLYLCDKAIELLRDTARTYYLVELLGFYEELLFGIIKSGSPKVDTTEPLKERYHFAKETKQTLMNVYRRHNIDLCMKNDAYLYDETEIYHIGDVLRKRRMMFGYSRKKLAELAKCSEKTIYRAENGKVRLQGQVFRDIFQTIGLPTEFIVRELITPCAEVFLLMQKRIEADWSRNYSEERAIIREIEKLIPVEHPQNSQYISCWNAYIDREQGMIDSKVYRERIQRAIHMTVPMEINHDMKELFLTKMEILCFHLLVVDGMATRCEDKKHIDLLREYFMQIQDMSKEGVYIYTFELVMTTLASIYGNQGDYNASDQISHRIITLCLNKGRLHHVFKNIYNLVWNRMQTVESLSNSTFITQGLRACITISHYCRRHGEEKFFVDKLNSIRA